MPNPTPSFFHNFRSIESNSYKAYLKLDFPVVLTTKDSVLPHIFIPNSIPLQTKKKKKKRMQELLHCATLASRKRKNTVLWARSGAGAGLYAFLCSVHRSKNQKW